MIAGSILKGALELVRTAEMFRFPLDSIQISYTVPSQNKTAAASSKKRVHHLSLQDSLREATQVVEPKKIEVMDNICINIPQRWKNFWLPIEWKFNFYKPYEYLVIFTKNLKRHFYVCILIWSPEQRWTTGIFSISMSPKLSRYYNFDLYTSSYQGDIIYQQQHSRDFPKTKSAQLHFILQKFEGTAIYLFFLFKQGLHFRQH